MKYVAAGQDPKDLNFLQQVNRVADYRGDMHLEFFKEGK